MKCILLVEDSKLLRMASERVLTKAGYSVVSLDDGEQVLPIAKQRTPDLILLDMLLPNLSGQQVLRALKDDPATAKIPVIVLSGLSQKNEMKLKRDGAAAYFEKSKLRLDGEFIGLLELVKGVFVEP
jgi:CheY-like chemotaxis protein